MTQPRVRAPRLPDNPALWLNTENGQALRLERGTVYLLDFWSYGCLNCAHVLPDLDFLEAKYHDRLFRVIGVHSGKFAGERDAENVRNAVRRLGITHPVVRDDDYAVWRAYAVRAWPTFALIDADGYLVLTLSGEGHRAELDTAVGELLGRPALTPLPPLPISSASRMGEGVPRTWRSAAAFPDSYLGLSPRLSSSPLPPAKPEKLGEGPGVRAELLYPSKVLADPVGERLFISDTGHGRIVVFPLSLEGGGPHTAHPGFVAPQGMVLTRDGQTLYIADAGAHQIKMLDLATAAVTTVAGTGRQAIGCVIAGTALATNLNSPWDVLLSEEGDRLYIAMAGSHQIAVLHLAKGDEEARIEILAGTGREGRADGAAHEAAFAQPSGLATDGQRLFIVDSESSCIRAMTLDNEPRVTTLAGGDLFDFGFQDGIGDAARFQHPLGLVFDSIRAQLYVADAYNSRVRILDLPSRQVTTLLGSGDRTELYEPSGLSLAADRLYIADTNNHRIRSVRLSAEPPTVATVLL